MGRGKNKGKRGGRGTSRSYVTSLEDMEARNTRESAWKRPSNDGDSSEDESEEASKTEPLHDSAEAEAAIEILRIEEEERKEAKIKGAQGIIKVENPNYSAKVAKNIKVKDMDVEAEAAPLSRREREAIEAEKKKQQYQKKHAAGETDEAKNDMERLAQVRARREQQAKDHAILMEKMSEEEMRRREHMAKNGMPSSDSESEGNSDGSSDDAKNSMPPKSKVPREKTPKIEKLNSIEVKKMNPSKLKELLKERGESVQGVKKDLIARLLAWEKEHHG